MFIFYIICFFCFWKVVKKSERWDYLIKKLERKSFFWMVMRKICIGFGCCCKFRYY